MTDYITASYENDTVYIEFDVEFVYTSGQRASWGYSGGDPGCPAQVEICEVTVLYMEGKGYKKTCEELCRNKWINDLEQLMYDYCQDNDEILEQCFEKALDQER